MELDAANNLSYMQANGAKEPRWKLSLLLTRSLLQLKKLLKSRGIEAALVDHCFSHHALRLLGLKSGVLTEGSAEIEAPDQEPEEAVKVIGWPGRRRCSVGCNGVMLVEMRSAPDGNL